jgi:hypothetical protein
VQINDLLATGSSYASILRVIDDDNTGLDARDRVTVDSLRTHSRRHFPVQNAARATYREILERQAKENGVDFVNGLTTAITPMALLETVVVKGYQTLVDPNTEVDVKTAISAASRLQELLDARAGHADVAQMMAQMNRIIDLVRTFVPQERWPALQSALNDGPAAIDAAIPKYEQPKVRLVDIDDRPDGEDEAWLG